jgi:hypothetical protein
MDSQSDFSSQRRAFLGGVAFSVGGVAMATLLPCSLLQAAPAGLLCGAHDPCGDWQLDDICNSYPPYAFRIDTGVPLHVHVATGYDAVDRHWVS